LIRKQFSFVQGPGGVTHTLQEPAVEATLPASRSCSSIDGSVTVTTDPADAMDHPAAIQAAAATANSAVKIQTRFLRARIVFLLHSRLRTLRSSSR